MTDGALVGLAAEFGASILGVVFAHEYGHVIQARAGVLGRELPTIVSEQQADCFAGAWVATSAAAVPTVSRSPTTTSAAGSSP